jgi:hypothetical protein
MYQISFSFSINDSFEPTLLSSLLVSARSFLTSSDFFVSRIESSISQTFMSQSSQISLSL